jgi:DNA-binding NarL/FixJ family response regulator
MDCLPRVVGGQPRRDVCEGGSSSRQNFPRRCADEAVRLAKSESPTLAIMDIRLIGKADGVDAALEIFRETGIRCIFATAHHDARMRSRAEPAAPLGWLPKPYGAHALVAMVEHVVAGL